ncbi:MAG TPA: RtcB family protein, partial [Nannocystis sp.]
MQAADELGVAPEAAIPPMLLRVGECLYELPRGYRPDMRVPARIFADEVLLPSILRDQSVPQLINVATLPGVVGAAVGMPDMHEGYGFPVGGVAATQLPDGVISPGGIGFDINCGVRLVTTPLRREELAPRLEAVMHELSRSVPTGYGRTGPLTLTDEVLDRVLGE